MFSIHAVCNVLDSYGIGENGMMEILRNLKDAGKIKNGYVLQKDLDKEIQAMRLDA